MATTLARLIQRSGTTEEWAAANPILAAGEFGVDSTLGRAKLGDGVNPWSGLQWAILSADEVSSMLASAATIAAATGANDAVMTAVAADPGSAFAIQQSAKMGVLRPSQYGAIGDGVVDDKISLQAMYSAASTFGLSVALDAGKTYKVASSLTATVDTDLNGATLNITGRLTLATGKLCNGSVSITDKVDANGLDGVRILDVTVTAPNTTSNGIHVTDSTDVVIAGCTRVGGFRGIVVERCSGFEVHSNVVRDLPTGGAYGIIALGADHEIYSGGSIYSNRVVDCYFGIALWGGEANSAQPGFIADDYTLQRIRVFDNEVVCTDPADNLIGCIYATRSRWVSIDENKVLGGRDVGVDFEYCADSSAHGNDVNDIVSGGLAAIFGSKRIAFTSNRVTFTRTKPGSASTSGVTWKGTSNSGLLLRDDPQDIRIVDNSFHCLNGTLMQLVGADLFDRVTFTGNDMLDAYYVTFTTTAGDATMLEVSYNRVRFTINVNRPAIMAQVCKGVRILYNTVTLPAGEVQESNTRPTICVVDPAASYSSAIEIRGNRVTDPAGAANNQIGVVTGSATIDAVVADNIADRIVGSYLSGAIHPNFQYGRNTPVSGVGTTRLTGYDNATAWLAVASTTRRDPRTTGTAGLTLTDRDTYVYTGAGTTWTLPPLSGYAGAEILIRNRGTGAVTLNSSTGGNDIFTTSAVATLSIAAGATARLLHDGTYWTAL